MNRSHSYSQPSERGGNSGVIDPMLLTQNVHFTKTTRPHGLHMSSSRVTLKTLAAVTVCVDYSDFLRLCVDENIKHLDRWFIISDNKDTATHQLCSQYPEITLIKTDAFYENGALFNKGKALNIGIQSIPLDAGTWILILDADIMLPLGFRDSLDARKLNSHTLYGASRYMCYKEADFYSFRDTQFKDYSVLSKMQRFRNKPIGYFQLFNSLNLGRANFSHLRPYPEHHSDASCSDMVFLKKFHRRIVMRSVPVVHLGHDGKNWRGRVTSRWGEAHLGRSASDPVKNPKQWQCADLLRLEKSHTFGDFQFCRIDSSDVSKHDDLAIVTCYFNPSGNKNILSNYFQFKRFIEPYATLYTVELLMDGASSMLGPDENLLQVWGTREKNLMFQKECLLNIGISYVLNKTEVPYICWADADILFANKRWHHDTVAALEHSLVTQPFSGCTMLDHEFGVQQDYGRPSRHVSSIKYWDWMGRPADWGIGYQAVFPVDNGSSKSGLVWAARREFFEHFQLEHRCFIGGADALMVGSFTSTDPWWLVHRRRAYGSQFIPCWETWSSRLQLLATSLGLKTVSFVEGSVYHMNHGTAENRRYSARNLPLIDANCNVMSDVALGANGLLRFTNTGLKKGLQEIVDSYYSSRKEDEFLNDYSLLEPS
jgi:hypothetical protein